MNTWSTYIGSALASLDYLASYLWRFLKLGAPLLLPLLAFAFLFTQRQYFVSFLALALGACFLFFLVERRSRSLPGWNLFSSVVLAVFLLIVSLGVLLVLSLATLRPEWTIFALFFLFLSFLFLLFAYFFKGET